MSEFVGGGVPTPQYAVAPITTTTIAAYNFNTGGGCVTQGWTTHDVTAQPGDYVHVDNFAGLGGGTYGLLVPLAGTKSLWIGGRPSDPAICSYPSLPGYGNGWKQTLQSKCFTLTGSATVSYLASWDSEPGYDFTYVEYDNGCSGSWTAVGSINGGQGSYDNQQVSTPQSFVLTAGEHGATTRFRFRFQSDGAASDGDQYIDTDGAFILDDLLITDAAGTQSSETFEAEAVGAHGTLDGHWSSSIAGAYGNYAAQFSGLNVLQQDQCAKDLSCMWAFFSGSTYNYACGGFPSVTAVPFGNGNGQYIANEIWSPQLAWTGTGNGGVLELQVYRDLPLDNLVFYVWGVRSYIGAGSCPTSWFTDNTLYYGDEKDWLGGGYPFGQFVVAGATHIQISIGVVDYCEFLCGTVGSGACHSHSPLIDNVKVKRYDAIGATWQINGWQKFQDNFAGDGTVTGTVRIDAANDILPTTNFHILPGDTASAVVIDPFSPIANDAAVGGKAIYMYVAVYPQGQATKSGNALTDDATRWPVVGSVVGPGGITWWKVRFDRARTSNNTHVVPNEFCVDLNDNLFTPGDRIDYFYEAVSTNGNKSYFFGGYRAFDAFDGGGVLSTNDINIAYANPMEMECLPSKALQDPANDILYVDDGDGRAVEPYFDQAFQMMGILDRVDRYDVTAPSSALGNGPGGRVTDVLAQITPYYKKIIWNSEELNSGTIGDGSSQPEKGDDFGLLFSFLNNSTKGPGLYISGDGVAEEWATLTSASATNLKSVFLNFNLVTADHKTVGLSVSPRVIAAPGSAFSHASGPDTLIAFGGCFGINKFDVLTPTGSAVSQMRYNGNPAYSAVISQTTTNSSSATARVLLEGFSYDLIRDDRPNANGGVMDRVHHLYDVITFLQNTVDQPVGTPSIPHTTTLSQNYPNPFNPSTSIEFTVRERTRVSLKVYDVSGQLVRTLLEGDRAPGELHRVNWDGRNDAGQSVSSGVYFYRLVASDFTQTRKMVLLK